MTTVADRGSAQFSKLSLTCTTPLVNKR